MTTSFLSRTAAWLAVGGVTLLGATAQAQTLDFGSCVRVEDLSARLACYDRAAGRSSTSAAPVSAAPAPAPVAPPPAARAPAVAPAPVAPPAPVAMPKDPVAAFGASSVTTKQNDSLTAAKVQKAEEEAALPKQIESTVASVRTRPRGEQVLTLENGQVWEQTESKREPVFSTGDVVVIRRGMLGSFLLTLQKGSPTTRVKRIS